MMDILFLHYCSHSIHIHFISFSHLTLSLNLGASLPGYASFTDNAGPNLPVYHPPTGTADLRASGAHSGCYSFSRLPAQYSFPAGGLLYYNAFKVLADQKELTYLKDFPKK